jgi:hypothetical protein
MAGRIIFGVTSVRWNLWRVSAKDAVERNGGLPRQNQQRVGNRKSLLKPEMTPPALSLMPNHFAPPILHIIKLAA